MEKIIVRFTTKSSSPSLSDAKLIAEKCDEHYYDGDFCFAHFEEPTQDLKKLLDLIGRWKTTKIHINDDEYPVSKVSGTIFCPQKLLCNGVCTHPTIGHDSFVRFKKRLDIEEDTGFLPSGPGRDWEHERVFEHLTFCLTKEDDNKFRIDKDKLEDYVKDEYFFELEFCPIIKEQETLDLVRGLPDYLSIRSQESLWESRERASQHYYPPDIEKIGDIELFDKAFSDEENYEKMAKAFVDELEKRLPKIIKKIKKDL